RVRALPDREAPDLRPGPRLGRLRRVHGRQDRRGGRQGRLQIHPAHSRNRQERALREAPELMTDAEETSMTRSTRLSRRTVLRGLGTAIALPWLEAMAPAARAAFEAVPPPGPGAPRPRRMAF